MREISKLAAKRFLACKKFSKTNTKVKVDGSCCSMWLFRNIIAANKNHTIIITFASHRTRTTVDRLEAITGLQFSIAKDTLRYRCYPNDEWTEISSCEWYKLVEKDGRKCLESLK